MTPKPKLPAAEEAPVSDDFLFPLTNRELDVLAELVFANRGRSAEQLEPEVWQEISRKRDRLAAFLWRVVLHLTEDGDVAAHVWWRTKTAFFERLGWTSRLTPLGRGLSRLIWRLNTSRSWVVREATKTLPEVIAEKVAGTLGQPPVNVPAGVPAARSDFVALVKVCQLRQHRRSRQLCRNGYCRKACDVLYYHYGLELTFKEIGFATGLPRSTITGRSYDCDAELMRLRRDKGSQKSPAS